MFERVTPGVIYRAILLAFGLVVVIEIFPTLVTLILAVLIMVIIAIPMAALADLLKRWRIPRFIGAFLALLIGLGALAGLLFLIIPVFSQEVNKFITDLPSISSDFLHRIARLTGTSAAHISHQISHFIDNYKNHPSTLLGPVASVGATALGVIVVMVVILLTALYTAIHPDPLVNGIARLFPVRNRTHARHVLSRLLTAYLGWLVGLIIGMVILGGLTYLGLTLVGLNFAAFFAVFTAFAMIVPYFGALASSIVPILYALTFSTGKAILVAIVYIVAHQIESNMIEPLVVARAVKLHPAVVAIGVIAVERLFGFVGLIVAVPIISTFMILVEELWVNRIAPRVPEGPDAPTEDQRDELGRPVEAVSLPGARGRRG